MGTRGLSFLKAHLNLVGTGLLNRFLQGNMPGVVTSFWVLLCNFLFFVFGSVDRCFSRFQAAEKSEKNDESSCFAGSHEDDGTDSEGREIENRGHKEDVIGSDGGEEGSVFVETASSKYQFCTGRDISGFVEQPKLVRFTVQEVFEGSSDDYTIHGKDLVAELCVGNEFGEEETEAQEPTEDSLEKDGSVQSIAMDKVLDNRVREPLMDHQLSEKAEILESEDEFLDDDAFLGEEEMILDDLSSQADLELESVCSDDGIVFGTDSASTFHAHEQQHLENCTVNAGDERIPSSEEDEMLSETTLDPEAAFVANQSSDSESESDDDLIDVQLQKLNFSHTNKSSCKNSVEDNHNRESLASDDMELMMANSENSQELGQFQENSSALDSDDNWDWEHDDIIEQLKMELKNVRTGGLPTILEESETDSPMIGGDDDLKLKPLKIDQKLEHKDLLQEIQKVHKNYAEKMRKLDILNYQTLHAIDDSSRENKGKAADENAISIETLVETIEESMRVFWDFIRADRYELDVGSKQSQLDQQDSADSVLMTALRTQLQKKERRLKDIVRSGNCIVKRFQKPRDRLDLAILFAQVELRLVSRVLSMRKVTRDQLAWCHNKLDRINIISRKVYVEPSFLLFPC
ncbi:hypothetical protein EUGRSUZ_B03443 [Eucalyptus grandis]|uniref:Uncharacterized protein n=2 Tax=Eucalyptus grandis TaxID=71139 RepID=A0ACC3LWM4_EUCGR|nr:hypothetical protein EUGRSUZ_B03443 [Eucalyptus grandis]